MTITILRNADIYADNGIIIAGGTLCAIDGYVHSLSAEQVKHIGAAELDCGYANASAGWIDCQVNGVGSILFEDVKSAADIETIGEFLLARGTTRWLGALVSTPMSKLEQLAPVLERCIGHYGLLGIHLEGPWLNPEYCGCHPKSRLRSASREHVAFLEQMALHGIVMVTIAPEIICPEDLVRLTENAAIRLFAGHSDWTWATQADGAQVYGATHILNGMPPLAARRPGGLGWVASDSSRYGSIIADGAHVSIESLTVAKRALGPAQLFLISDSMPLNLAMEGKLPFLKGPCRIEGCAIIDAAGTLAGSVSTIQDGLRHLVQHVGVPLDEAIRMATEYPARALQLPKCGSLSPGRLADYVLFDNQLNVLNAYRVD